MYNKGRGFPADTLISSSEAPHWKTPLRIMGGNPACDKKKGKQTLWFQIWPLPFSQEHHGVPLHSSNSFWFFFQFAPSFRRESESAINTISQSQKKGEVKRSRWCEDMEIQMILTVIKISSLYLWQKQIHIFISRQRALFRRLVITLVCWVSLSFIVLYHLSFDLLLTSINVHVKPKNTIVLF